MGAPIEVNVNQAIGLPSPGGSVQTKSGGLAEAGMMLAAPGGMRLFYGTAVDQCIFISADRSPAYIGKLGKVYMQTRFSFAEDISVGGVGSQLATNLAGTQAVIKNFLDVFMGAVSCAGGPVAWAVTGMNAAVTIGKIKREFSTYSKGMESLYYYMRYCSTRTPQLTQSVLSPLIFDTLTKKLQGKGVDLLTGALPGPKVAGKLTGVLIGAFGEDQVAVRLKAISDLMKEVLVKVALHQEDHPGETLSQEQVAGLAKHVIKQLKPAGLPPAPADAETIVREVAANCFHVRKPLSDIAAALDTL